MGLAAIQLGIPTRYFVVVHEYEPGKFDNYVLINPKIVSTSEEMIYVGEGEGCLSVNREVCGIVPRQARVTMEAYDEDGGGWSLAKGFINKTDWSTLTWQRVIKVMYSLRNNIPYNQLKDINENPDMGDVMQSIAWINLSKMPGGKSSSDRKYIKKYREHWRIIVLEQIRTYFPDVIIFCNTLDACCFFDFFPNGKQPEEYVYYTDKNGQKKRFIDIFKKGGTILLDVFHPARTMSHEMEEQYVDKLVETINKYCHE